MAETPEKPVQDVLSSPDLKSSPTVETYKEPIVKSQGLLEQFVGNISKIFDLKRNAIPSQPSLAKKDNTGLDNVQLVLPTKKEVTPTPAVPVSVQSDVSDKAKKEDTDKKEHGDKKEDGEKFNLAKHFGVDAIIDFGKEITGLGKQAGEKATNKVKDFVERKNEVGFEKASKESIDKLINRLNEFTIKVATVIDPKASSILQQPKDTNSNPPGAPATTTTLQPGETSFISKESQLEKDEDQEAKDTHSILELLKNWFNKTDNNKKPTEDKKDNNNAAAALAGAGILGGLGELWDHFKNKGKTAEKAAEKEAEKAAEKEAEKVAEKEGAKALEKEGAKTAEKVAEKEGAKALEKEGAKTAEKVAEKEGVKVAEKEGIKVAEKEGIKVAEKAGAKALGKSVLKKIPGIGLVAGLGFGAQRALEGDWTGAGLEVASGAASTLPGAGTAASIGIDAALAGRDIYKATHPEPGKQGEEAKTETTDKKTPETVKPAEAPKGINPENWKQLNPEQQKEITKNLETAPLGKATALLTAQQKVKSMSAENQLKNNNQTEGTLKEGKIEPVSTPETAKAESIKPETAKAESIKPETAKAEPSKPVLTDEQQLAKTTAELHDKTSSLKSQIEKASENVNSPDYIKNEFKSKKPEPIVEPSIKEKTQTAANSDDKSSEIAENTKNTYGAVKELSMNMQSLAKAIANSQGMPSPPDDQTININASPDSGPSPVDFARNFNSAVAQKRTEFLNAFYEG